MEVFIHVQHLLGSGHVVRACALGQALAARGARIRIAHGNRLPPTLSCDNLEMVALPFAKTRDVFFKEILDQQEKPLDEVWWLKRLKATREALVAKPCDIFITETFPFGRRSFAQEYLYLISLARNMERRPLVVSSIRDILVRKKQAYKEQWMAAQASELYDLVLVHSDPSLIQLRDSFPYTSLIEDKIHYTGFISSAKSNTIGGSANEKDGFDEIIISCGGGAVGLKLLETAIACHRLASMAQSGTWRILVGNDIHEQDFSRLQQYQSDRLIVERARSDFTRLLKRARLSVSQAGYNSTLDVLGAQIRSVMIPFSQGHESEQLQRAQVLQEKSRVQVVEEHQLTPQSLACAIQKALAAPLPELSVDMNGAENSARILIDALAKHRR
ncbi:glycosyltransferase family protein [Polycladidibacter stylochi]|uniref:glycosyltransferase family protein n=1 Tax=Polycladidibacter stylochi TaxID=1807766 RepID=UPI00082AF382|nr:glycosyltransferase [Pseudovibrio stylochi]